VTRGIARVALWPVFVAASAAAYAWALAHGGSALGVAFAIPAAQILVLLLLEGWLPGDARGGAWRDPALAGDLAHVGLGNVVGGALGEALLLAALALAAGGLGAAAGAALWPRGWPFAAQAALVVLLADGLDVLRHRAMHASPRAWRVHAVHHAGDRLHALKAGRNHFLDVASRGLLVFAPLALAGAPREVLLAYPAAVAVLGPIAHANLELRIPAWLHRIALTPAVHRLHHARCRELAGHNYANVLPLWDLLLGSFLDPAACGRPACGLDDDPNPPGFWAQVAAPLGAGRGPRRSA